MRPYLKNKLSKMTIGVGQVAEHVPSKFKTLVSIPSTGSGGGGHINSHCFQPDYPHH
jgi:hypothetical protein